MERKLSIRFDSSLDDVFHSRSHVRILRALLRLPEGLPASGREVARRAGVTHPTALKALAVLADAGLVTVGRSRTGDMYELNSKHLFVDEIVALYRTESDMTQKLASFLRDELLARTNRVERATLFGSVVWGESTPTSDIDLALSCALTEEDEVREVIDEVGELTRFRFGNRVSPLINTRKSTPNKGIWKRIEEEGVPLIRSGKPMPI